MKSFVIDISKCNGCYSCQIACKDEHVGNDWTPYAKPQPDTGHFWIKVNEKERGSVPKVKVSYTPVLCAHCDNPPCLAICTENAIYKRKDGLVIIDPEKCTGCRRCLDVCTYGALYFNPDLNIAQKCTGCAHLLDKNWKEPRCVEACPTGALVFGEEKDLKHLLKNAEAFCPESDCKPRVFYLNLPRLFVAGAVFDPVEDECTEGAIATIKDLVTGEEFSARTDNYGDFWINGVKAGKYSLSISKNGYRTKVKSITIEKDTNIGDIALLKR